MHEIDPSNLIDRSKAEREKRLFAAQNFLRDRSIRVGVNHSYYLGFILQVADKQLDTVSILMEHQEMSDIIFARINPTIHAERRAAIDRAFSSLFTNEFNARKDEYSLDQQSEISQGINRVFPNWNFSIILN